MSTKCPNCGAGRSSKKHKRECLGKTASEIRAAGKARYQKAKGARSNAKVVRFMSNQNRIVVDGAFFGKAKQTAPDSPRSAGPVSSPA